MGLAAGVIIINLLLFIGSVALCMMFSFLETSMMVLRLFQLKELAQRTGRYKRLFHALENDPNRLLNAILIAYNLANTIAVITGTFVLDELMVSLPSTVRWAIGVLVLTVGLTLFGDILPKNVVRFRGEKYFAATLWLTNLTFYLLYPFVNLLGKLTDMLLRLFIGDQTVEDIPVTSEKEIQFLINYIDEKGLMETEKTGMLLSIFRLSTTPVRDIMVPGTDIVMIEASKSVQDAYDLFVKHQFSRIPVYKEQTHNVIGMLHFKDLVPLWAKDIEQPLREIVRPILFIPESIKVNQLLQTFKKKHMHIAMVINEHGSITGLATLEDVIEEIVGEIHDEYEAITERIVSIGKGLWMVDGRAELDKLGALLKVKFETEAAVTTLGGFLTERFQRLPRKGERLVYDGYSFQVRKVSSKKVLQVLVKSEAEQLHPPATHEG